MNAINQLNTSSDPLPSILRVVLYIIRQSREASMTVTADKCLSAFAVSSLCFSDFFVVERRGALIYHIAVNLDALHRLVISILLRWTDTHTATLVNHHFVLTRGGVSLERLEIWTAFVMHMYLLLLFGA